MPDTTSNTSKLIKWIGGIITAVITAVFITFIGNKFNQAPPAPSPVPKPTIIDIAGIWQTPFKDLIYDVTQHDSQFEWIITQNYVKGTGTIQGNTIILDLNGENVTYTAKMQNSSNNPQVLITTHEKYRPVILFRGCNNLKKFLHNFSVDYPTLAPLLLDTVKQIPNQTCPDIMK